MEKVVIVHVIPVLRDNYAYVCERNGECWVVDPGAASPIQDWLSKRELLLKGFLITHHHHDHTGGLDDLMESGHQVYGDFQVELATDLIEDGSIVPMFAGIEAKCLHIPGHTLGAMAILVEGNVFTGDVLFGGGIGRIFEGTAEQMLESLDRLSQLPDQTQVYFGHEYTKSNLEFALQVEPSHQALLDRCQALGQLSCSTPSTIAIEKETNPFLRVREPRVIDAVSNWSGKRVESAVDCLRLLREWKNKFDETGK